MNINHPLSRRRILWERTKRPIVFVMVCLLAAIALLFLQNKKLDFEKVNAAPLVVVEQSYKNMYDAKVNSNDPADAEFRNQSRFLRIASSSDLLTLLEKEPLKAQFKKFFPQRSDAEIEKMAADKEELRNLALRQLETASVDSPANPTDEEIQNKIKEIKETVAAQTDALKKAIPGVQYQTFKSEDELINGIYDVIKKHKEANQKILENKKSNSDKELSEFALKKDLFENYLKDNTAFNLDDFTAKVAASPISQSAAFAAYLKGLKTNRGKIDSEQVKKRIKSDLESNEEKLIQKQAKSVRDLNNFDDNYEAVYGFVFKALKNKEIIDGKFQKSQINPVYKNIFDGKNGLSVVYWLVEITLKVIIVLALLFVILIPLKHIFFITTSSDYLIEQGRKSAEKVAPAAIGLTTITKAVIVTLTTIGIGAAALAGQTFSSSVESAEKKPDVNTFVPIKKDNSEKPPAQPPTALLPPEIVNLKDEINALKTTIATLNETIVKTDFEGLQAKVDRVEQKTDELIGVVGKKEELIGGTLAQQTSGITNLAGATGKQVEEITRQISPPNGTQQSETLFTKLDNVSQALVGKKDNFADDLKPNADPKNLKEALGTLWSVLGAKEFAIKSANLPPSTASGNEPLNVFETVQGINSYIGKPNDFAPLAAAASQPTIPDNQPSQPSTLFGKVNYVSRSIGTEDYLNTPSSSIFKTLGKVSASVPGGGGGAGAAAPSLLEISREIERNALLIHNNTADIGRYVLGGEGGSFFTQVRNSLSGEKYLVTEFSIEVLKKFYENDPEILKVLKEFRDKLDADKTNATAPKTFLNQTLSAKEITERLGFAKNSIEAERWEKVKPAILRYLRVTRY